MQNRSFGRFTLLSLLAMALFGAACKHPHRRNLRLPVATAGTTVSTTDSDVTGFSDFY